MCTRNQERKTVVIPRIIFRLTSRELAPFVAVSKSHVTEKLAIEAKRTIAKRNLIDEEYQISKFRDHERIISQTFPELNLTANQIFQASL